MTNVNLKNSYKRWKLKIIKYLGSFSISNDLLSRYLHSFPDILRACIIFLLMPAITVAGAEQSFSKLKLIINYLRNSCGRMRLSSIVISNI